MIKDIHKIHNMQEELKSDLIKCAVFIAKIKGEITKGKLRWHGIKMHQRRFLDYWEYSVWQRGTIITPILKIYDIKSQNNKLIFKINFCPKEYLKICQTDSKIKEIHVQSCLNCRPKPICDCGYQGIGFEIKDCRRINLLVGNHGVGKSFALAHVNLEGKPFVQISGMETPIETTYYASDVKVFELAMAKNHKFSFPPNPIYKFLILDEIGNNTHHSIHKPFWINLIKQIIEYDLQVFATTHSYEMIEALVEAAKEYDFIEKDEIRLFKIVKRGNETLVGSYTAEEIEAKVDSGLEIR